MAKFEIVCGGEEGLIIFDKDEMWFNYVTYDKHVHPIMMFRPGNFDITAEELAGIKKWLKENLKDGVLQG